jgi:hypothetical protein
VLYIFHRGIPELINGPYSIGYYTNGVLNSNYRNNVPQLAIDNNQYFTYQNGASIDASYFKLQS